MKMGVHMGMMQCRNWDGVLHMEIETEMSHSLRLAGVVWYRPGNWHPEVGGVRLKEEWGGAVISVSRSRRERELKVAAHGERGKGRTAEVAKLLKGVVKGDDFSAEWDAVGSEVVGQANAH
ncbi:hypothetical protein CYMTET_27205 [Cymbomonas tetramitiformis]|uniref:Uncharacterized protein n=1 Tax=Cymbomonas tetramitiformis TaxID=36881 RepID=A0AAE0FQV3_9CHLO|nr:hypothetical protein CYMTET_27205 [Cymbomonas tetramitiformis]